MTVAPATVNWTVYAGARFFKTITVDFDLTGYTIEMQARTDYGEDVLTGWDLATTGGSPAIIITSTGASESTFTVDLADTVTSTVPGNGVARYDIRLTDGDGNKNYYLQGRLTWDKRITQ